MIPLKASEVQFGDFIWLPRVAQYRRIDSGFLLSIAAGLASRESYKCYRLVCR